MDTNTAGQGTEPHNGVWTEQAVRNVLGEPINGRDDNSWVDYELALNLCLRIIAQEQDAQPGTTEAGPNWRDAPELDDDVRRMITLALDRQRDRILAMDWSPFVDVPPDLAIVERAIAWIAGYPRHDDDKEDTLRQRPT